MALAAIDRDDLAGHEGRFVRSDEDDRVGKLLRLSRGEPIGTVVTSAALFFGVPVKRLSMPVSVGPGATALTRTPDPATSSAADLVTPSTACLLPT